ncbi:MAG: anti-sigma factor [Acidimicrobiia bacterium]|nr:anti-sigma factor [Acidimicrobiia bacterium]
MTPDERGEDSAIDVPDALAALLGADTVWTEPPDIADELVARIEQEARLQGDDQPRPAAAGRPRPWRRWAMAGAAAAAVIVGIALVVNSADDDDREPAGVEFAIVGTELAPDASGTGVVQVRPAGFAIIIEIQGLDPAVPGTFYQGWVRSDDGDLVAVGTFHAREDNGPIALWSGVDLDDYPTLTVTTQQIGAGTGSSGEQVLVARFDGS